MNKFECDACVDRKCIVCAKGPETPKYCTVVENMMASWKAVKEEMDKEVKEETVSRDNLQKLTVDIFDRPDCPKWAEYAAVDIDGITCVYQDKPHIKGSEWVAQYPGVNWWVISGHSDASDWKNSLIERPKKVKLPDWCKVGEWGYDTEDHGYFEIVDITPVFVDVHLLHGGRIQRSYNAIKNCCVEAKKRPFNEKEMKALVGKVLETPNIAVLISAYGKPNGDISTPLGNYTAESLMDKGFVIDGEPCFELEHLNEKGEWVE